mgnify:CR=1 FL=1
MREWRLRSFLALQLVMVAVVTFLVVGAAILVYRLPQAEADSRQQASEGAIGLMRMVEREVHGLEVRMQMLATQTGSQPAGRMQALLDAAVAGGGFDALFLLRSDGTPQAYAVMDGRPLKNPHLADFSGNSVFRLARARNGMHWSHRYLSVLSGRHTTAVAMAVGQQVLIGEISQSYLGGILAAMERPFDRIMLVIDGRGGRVVDHGLDVRDRQRDWGEYLQQWARSGSKESLERVRLAKGRHHLGLERSDKLNWYFLIATPAGMSNPRYSITVWLVTGGFCLSVILGVLFAPQFARIIARPVQQLAAMTRQIAAGDYCKTLARGHVHEINQLADDLESMAAEVLKRQKALTISEDRLQSIFAASPLPMAVLADTGDNFLIASDSLLLDVNRAWLELFGQQRSMVGQPLALSGILPDGFSGWLTRGSEESAVTGEAWLQLAGDTQILCEMTAQPVLIDAQPQLIWVLNDITGKRMIEEELRRLNVELESRVALRTRDLAAANAELTQALERLQLAQSELIHAEKLAALGGVVAGVAHELSTPIGNGLMAVSALGDELRNFQKATADGLRRSVLEGFVDKVGMAVRIAQRNLERAGDLIYSFKQVAVDQTSSQRRKFDLREVVDEILVTLNPMLKRTPYQIRVEIPKGIKLDSYPGPFGQVLTNLVNNAVTHGFDDREHGQVTVSGEMIGDAQIGIRVSDDGRGIPEALLGQIFEPFFTTCRGRGGTGLGLHIAYNAITGILGGQITVNSIVGQGSEFIITLPSKAPVLEERSDTND